MSTKNPLINIRNFIQGYSREYYNYLVGLPKHEQEQIEYRISLCKDDCAITGKCKVCGCTFPSRLFTTGSCNPERFPDIMTKEVWEEFKQTLS